MEDWKTIYTVQTWVTPALIKVEFQFSADKTIGPQGYNLTSSQFFSTDIVY
jgi:hypothetical protein